MKHSPVVFLVLAMALFFAAWTPASGSEDEVTYYTRVGFHYEKGTHKTVNYLRGVFVPVNSEVTILKRKKNSILVLLADTGLKVKIENIQEWSGVDINVIFERMFSREPTNLDAHDPGVVKKIKSGTFATGMTKDEIILAIGYPPMHRTPSLESDQWRYWNNRFDTVLLMFKDGVLDAIKE